MGQSQRHIALVWLILAGDAEAHDWYTGKTDPVLHYNCCGNKDCHPIDSSDVRATKDGYYIRLTRPTYMNEPQGREWFIPRERVQATPDDRYHICERLMTFDLSQIPAHPWRGRDAPSGVAPRTRRGRPGRPLERVCPSAAQLGRARSAKPVRNRAGARANTSPGVTPGCLGGAPASDSLFDCYRLCLRAGKGRGSAIVCSLMSAT